jgi:hypothetical protein
MKCPCENCLIKPICRNKHYGPLHEECKIIRKYLLIDIEDTKHRKRVKILEKTLRSVRWKLGQRTETGFFVDMI